MVALQKLIRKKFLKFDVSQNGELLHRHKQKGKVNQKHFSKLSHYGRPVHTSWTSIHVTFLNIDFQTSGVKRIP